MSNAIGSVKLPNGIVVTLGRDMRWTSSDALNAKLFNSRFDPRMHEGLSGGLPLGYAIISEAAEWSGGTAILPPLPPLPPGVCS